MKKAMFYTSRCGVDVFKGNKQQLIFKYEQLANYAEKEKKYTEYHYFLQHAEHYKKQPLTRKQ